MESLAAASVRTTLTGLWGGGGGTVYVISSFSLRTSSLKCHLIGRLGVERSMVQSVLRWPILIQGHKVDSRPNPTMAYIF